MTGGQPNPWGNDPRYGGASPPPYNAPHATPPGAPPPGGSPSAWRAFAPGCLVFVGAAVLGAVPAFGFVASLVLVVGVVQALRRKLPWSVSGTTLLWVSLAAVLTFVVSLGRTNEARVESRRAEEARQQAVLQQQREQQRAARAREQAVRLRAEAPRLLPGIERTLESARAQLAANDYEGAKATSEQALEAVGPLAALEPPAEGVAALHQEIARVLAATRSVIAARDAVAEAEGLAREAVPPDVLAFDRELRDSEARLGALGGPGRERFEPQITATLRKLGQKRRSIRARVVRAEREEAARIAYMAVCGNEPPAMSSWDGEVVGTEAYARRTAHDPSSIDVENCTRPVLTRRLCWVTTCQVRGRNLFGAMVLNRMSFSIGRQGVLAAETAR